jgi:hypothetical protein
VVTTLSVYCCNLCDKPNELLEILSLHANTVQNFLCVENKNVCGSQTEKCLKYVTVEIVHRNGFVNYLLVCTEFLMAAVVGRKKSAQYVLSSCL